MLQTKVTLLHQPTFFACAQLCMLVWLIAGQVTFAEFAQYVVDTWSSGQALDNHWRPQHQLCNPCYVKFEFIGRYENLRRDTKHLLATLSASGGSESNSTFPFANVSFPFLNQAGTRSSQKQNLFYSETPRDTMRKLTSIYKFDYELFGYDYQWI